jgi:hypothetical protein
MEHKVVFGHLKHWYLLKDGTPKQQDKTLTEKTEKRLIWYVLVFNTFDESSHVELLLDESHLSLCGMLARAWAGEKMHKRMMTGMPEQLVIKRSAVDRTCLDPSTYDAISDELGLRVVENSDTAISANAITRRIETDFHNVCYRPENPLTVGLSNIAHIGSLVSAGVSIDRTFSMSTALMSDYVLRNKKGKQQSKPVPLDWTAKALTHYKEPPSSWRETEFRHYFSEMKG